MTASGNPEVAANLERAKESLEAARTLVEAELFDDATSRAYYATFYAATAALLAQGVRFAKHVGVLNGVNLHFVKAGRLDPELGRELSWLFDLRLVGDYGETRHVVEAEATRALETAERLVEALSRLAGAPPA